MMTSGQVQIQCMSWGDIILLKLLDFRSGILEGKSKNEHDVMECPQIYECISEMSANMSS